MTQTTKLGYVTETRNKLIKLNTHYEANLDGWKNISYSKLSLSLFTEMEEQTLGGPLLSSATSILQQQGQKQKPKTPQL